jgi:hypothetical protein
MKMTTNEAVDDFIDNADWQTIKYGKSEQRGLFVDQLARVEKSETSDSSGIVGVQENAEARPVAVRVLNYLTLTAWYPEPALKNLENNYPEQADKATEVERSDYLDSPLEQLLNCQEINAAQTQVTLLPALQRAAEILYWINRPPFKYSNVDRYYVRQHQNLLAANRNYYNDVSTGAVAPHGKVAYAYTGKPTRIILRSDNTSDAMEADW